MLMNLGNNCNLNWNMEKNVIIFIPNTLEKHKTGYLKGLYKEFKDCEAYYVIDDAASNNFTHLCIGYVGSNLKNCKVKKEKFLFVNRCNGQISPNSNDGRNHPVLEIIYDYKGFKNSDAYSEHASYGKHFTVITDELRKNRLSQNDNGRNSFSKTSVLFMIYLVQLLLKVIDIFKPILLYSATFLHFEESITNLDWFLRSYLNEKKVTPKLGNALIAKILDLLLGIILLNWFLKHENAVLNMIEMATEDIITNLKSLLLYLMGSPIGLKLNYAFNSTLGKFFFYHISLWRVFLQGMDPLMKSYFRFLVLPGALGFSFQVAMFSDIISIATFHVYCIYVYGARLFSLQISGLVSLWRLFIGRKFNPLRQRVDSCQYSQNQLFIGTLGFTVLLFLLPTTAMYYTVFTTFRLIILLMDGLLLRVRYLLNVLPFYVVILWIFKSPSLAGTIYINWSNASEGTDNVVIEAKLNTLPLTRSIKQIIPEPMQPIKGYSMGFIFHCMLTGVLL